MWLKLFFDFMYRFRKPPWDSGITPPEVVSLIESSNVRRHTIPPTEAHNTEGATQEGETARRALDLGCGTGTNSIYLAQHGFTVVGVDFSPKAIALAREKARRTGIAVDFHVADVTRLDFLREPFDVVLDIGCFHSVDAAGRARYAENLGRLTHHGSVFLLYAFSPRPPNERGHLIRFRNVGITPEEVQQVFARHFALQRVEHGMNRGERASAWYWFRRQ
jgi:SAM-dependent methyltransferase